MPLGDHLRDAAAVLVPGRDPKQGPLPPLLLMLTMVTGLIDAFSYLLLSHVLVANMTGNVVFFGFAVAEAPGFLWWASLLAIATFLVGALLGGRLTATLGAHRARHLGVAVGVQTLLIGGCWVASLMVEPPYGDGVMAALIAILGIAMGLQNATARALAVPDLTTTVLTLTITGIAADTQTGSRSSHLGRRLMPILAMLLGAVAGALLVVHGHESTALLSATLLGAAVALLMLRHRSSQEAWTQR